MCVCMYVHTWLVMSISVLKSSDVLTGSVLQTAASFSWLEENPAFVEIYGSDKLKTFQKETVNIAVSILIC